MNSGKRNKGSVILIVTSILTILSLFLFSEFIVLKFYNKLINDLEIRLHEERLIIYDE